jgi:hypothetical protein
MSASHLTLRYCIMAMLLWWVECAVASCKQTALPSVSHVLLLNDVAGVTASMVHLNSRRSSLDTGKPNPTYTDLN